KTYEPQRFESHWAEWWVENTVFRADPKAPGPIFSIVVPPPNVTGSMHIGHMLEHSVIDAAIRWRRMSGDNTLFLPGVDHAGIATQMLVERSLAAEGLTRQKLGREEFVKRVWAWKEKYGSRITEQMKRIGDSCDWTRERFTLSPELSRAVLEAFVRLYERGLIYRGTYMVNWCPRCQTALSDLETKHEDTQGTLWHIRYPLKDGSRNLVVATTRPETMLGDTAVAVNPNDPRYADLAGTTAILPLMNREIPIIFDELADPQFGTGVVKVTPAHDPNDLEAGKRHNLPHVKVIGEDARMTADAGAYAGLDRFAARKRVLADLEKLDLIEKIEPYTLAISKCDRCGTIVEPLVSTQWFVKTKPLAAKVLDAVNSGRIVFVPENWNKTFFNWMENIRDWCISRQLWWGHRIPAWHCADCKKITVARETPPACAHCGSARIEQDPDVLDTWFSSGLWPFSTLGWPDDTEDLRTYYPTSLLITGYDILFFWAARMMMLGLELTNDVPFRQVHLHTLVRDPLRQKMSKTKGNVVDPLDTIDRYGTDAVRLALMMSAAPGTDITYSEDRLNSARQFGNKMWNAARLILMNMEASGIEPSIPEPGRAETLEDRWIFSRLNATAESVNRALEQHRYHEVAEELWQFFWHDFCDWYLEIKKLRLAPNSGLTNDWRNLLGVFGAYLRLQHPIMPFITEELWHRFGQTQSIALAQYPQAGQKDEAAEHQMALLQEMITAARKLRADHGLDRKLVLNGVLYCRNGSKQVELGVIEKLANVKLDIRNEPAPKLEGAVRSTPDFDLLLELPAVDSEAQRARLVKEIDQLQKLIVDKDRQLANDKFLSSAPSHVVDSLRAKRGEYVAQLEKSRAVLNDLA
ncbi:MAG TPA: valine--tRNA ligase, partial [Bryobacteraceae bacterium]|nr:valine--tRNA ligase [Bryobacteraceae bacterium]